MPPAVGNCNLLKAIKMKVNTKKHFDIFFWVNVYLAEKSIKQFKSICVVSK